MKPRRVALLRGVHLPARSCADCPLSDQLPGRDRSSTLLAAGAAADGPHREAIEHLNRTGLQIAKLARDGLTSAESGTRMFISARTVAYHLGKASSKLGIISLAQLDRAVELALVVPSRPRFR